MVKKSSKVAKNKAQKLRTSDIKKNSGTEISHTIGKIKIEEKKIVLAMVLVILILVALVVCFVFTAINMEKIEGIKSGPLYIVFSENENGMSDTVNFSEEDGVSDADGAVIYTTQFKITNYQSSNSWYAVYLDDYQDMIDYHDCGEKQFNRDEIYFSIDNSESIMLSSVNYGGRHVITEGIIDANNDVVHDLKIWHMGYSDAHFHGKIVVKFLR